VINVSTLKYKELRLLFLYVKGYQGFEYFDSEKCWKAEKVIGDCGIVSTSIVVDTDCTSNTYQMSETDIFREMAEENIGLFWDQDGKPCLYYQAFPEIKAVNQNLSHAFMEVFVRKELGDIVESDIILSINLDKTRTKKGLTI
jgi:hypothetical protein